MATEVDESVVWIKRIGGFPFKSFYDFLLMKNALSFVMKTKQKN